MRRHLSRSLLPLFQPSLPPRRLTSLPSVLLSAFSASASRRSRSLSRWRSPGSWAAFCLISTLPFAKSRKDQGERRRGARGRGGRNGSCVPDSWGPGGVSNVQGRGCGLLLGGMGAPGSLSEEAVPGGDAGELQEPGLPGACRVQTGHDLPAGARGSTVDGRGRRPKMQTGSLGLKLQSWAFLWICHPRKDSPGNASVSPSLENPVNVMPG
ncbi:uncharacterized protein LOC122731648 [Dromiciops gliroides]|uniref:uncharacterized protein LOC122731648 n=1 Tax=Dromiciops gliroides TaxID=33562 RepID=UPI001CC69F31|nr:uncharacterized protein LOC122731648 [Dromiciops gliroides]